MSRGVMVVRILANPYTDDTDYFSYWFICVICVRIAKTTLSEASFSVS